MRRWAVVFLIISIIAAVFALGASDRSHPAQALFFVFLGVFALTLLASLIAGDKLPR